MVVAVKCVKCDQEVVRKGWFWVLATEANSKQVTFCPVEGESSGHLHEVAEVDD